MENLSATPRSLRLNGVTRIDRLLCTAKVRETIVIECHGWIGEFHQYSNTSLCLHFEVSAANLPLLRESLQSAEIRLGSESDNAFQDLINNSAQCEAIQCTLQLTFIHKEPDLRRHVLS